MARVREIDQLSRRERQIMDVVYRLGTVTAADIHANLPDAPTYTTVRGLLRILAEKGQVQVEQDGRRYIYKAAAPKPDVGASSIAHVVNTFFSGSAADAVAALLGSKGDRVSQEDLKRLSAVVAAARRNRSER